MLMRKYVPQVVSLTQSPDSRNRRGVGIDDHELPHELQTNHQLRINHQRGPSRARKFRKNQKADEIEQKDGVQHGDFLKTANVEHRQRNQVRIVEEKAASIRPRQQQVIPESEPSQIGRLCISRLRGAGRTCCDTPALM
jgi:hypothetical protein